ncbi:MAG: SDR family oxidoreductase [Flavobacteriales bacterium]|nr:SDR family oxidoreductase [Flavobacteriales bacterium]
MAKKNTAPKKPTKAPAKKAAAPKPLKRTAAKLAVVKKPVKATHKAPAKKERVLITGAAGFLGSHLCDRFLKEGYHVIAMDNLITGRLKNIEHLFKREDFEFYHHDVSTFVHVPGDLKYILHFASPASPIDYLKIPIQTLKVSSLGTHNLLGLAKAKGARILVASTSEVYGDPKVHPQNEEYWGHVNTVGPRGVYDEAKRFQEAITMAYHTYHGVETRMVRIFNTYGPRMRLNDGRVLPAFIGQALRGEDLTIFGKGDQTRSFCYVDDLIEGIYRLLLSDYAGPVNIGNPAEITIKQFAEEIVKLTGTKQKLVYKPLPQDDPMQRQPDITLAKKLLKWQPKVSRAEGLKITYAYFKSLSAKELHEKDHNSFEGYVRK